MPRKPIQRSNENYYHITARSNNREFFYLPILNVWEIMTDKLAKLQSAFAIKIAGFVLMDNHFHLLVLTPNEGIDRIMYFFMKDVTREIQKYTGRINKIFGGRYKGSVITNDSYLANVYKYIYRNPVAAAITDKAEDYPYSTLFFKTHKHSKNPFELEKINLTHALFEYEDLDELMWINQRFDESESTSIRCGLQKSIFVYEKDRETHRPIVPVIKHPKRKVGFEIEESK